MIENAIGNLHDGVTKAIVHVLVEVMPQITEIHLHYRNTFGHYVRRGRDGLVRTFWYL